jgi:hypothetical protein
MPTTHQQTQTQTQTNTTATNTTTQHNPNKAPQHRPGTVAQWF